MRAAVLLKRVDLRARVDPLTGEVEHDPYGGMSAADRCALELALQSGDDVVAVSAGPPVAEAVLREALAAGARRAVRVDAPAEAASLQVARALLPVLVPVAAAGGWVWAGDHSLDRGSGSVPAFVAGLLGVAQALGLSAVRLPEPGTTTVAGTTGTVPGRAPIKAQRRLDRGRRELLEVTAPALLSVEAGVARPRRPSLAGVLAARNAAVEVVASGVVAAPGGRVAPYRPRARVLPGPDPSLPARDRLVALSGALVARELPRILHVPPEQAADELLALLRDRWERA